MYRKYSDYLKENIMRKFIRFQLLVPSLVRIGMVHFDLCAHIIADLLWDERIDVEEAVKLVSVLPVRK